MELAGGLAEVLDRRLARASRCAEEAAGRTQDMPLDDTWARNLQRLGWVFGLVGRAFGSDLLGERRESEGLVTLANLLDEALAERGSGLRIAGLLPEPGRVQDGGLDAAWGLGVLAWIAARDRTTPLRVGYRRDGVAHGFRIEEPVGEELLASLRAARPRLPGTRLESDENGCTIVLADPCLVER